MEILFYWKFERSEYMHVNSDTIITAYVIQTSKFLIFFLIFCKMKYVIYYRLVKHQNVHVRLEESKSRWNKISPEMKLWRELWEL